MKLPGRTLFFVIAVLGGGCATSPAAGVGAPAVPPTEAVAEPAGGVSVRPAVAGATHYGDDAADERGGAAADALTGAVLRIAAEEATTLGARPPVFDARLAAAAAIVARGAEPGRAPPAELVDFAASHAGVAAPIPMILVGGAAPGGPAATVEPMRAALRSAIRRGVADRMGAALGPGGDVAIVALRPDGLDLAPFPRSLRAGGAAALRGTLASPYRAPRVVVTGVGGTPGDVPIRLDGRRFQTRIRCGAEAGTQRVEVLATGPAGPVVLANFPVWCGVDPPASFVIETPTAGAPVTDPRAAERALRALIREARAAAGLPPLTWDERLAAIARAHSEEMSRDDYVAHVSPRTGDVADRLRRAGVPYGTVMENVAAARTPAEAHAGLMKSPGHRAAILSPAAERVGVGVALGGERGEQLYVTELFVAPPEVPEPAAARAELQAAIARRRQAAGCPPLRIQPALERLAEDLAAGIAAGRLVPDAAPGIAAERLGPAAGQRRRIATLVARGTDLAAIAGEPAMVAPGFRAVGIGVAPARDPGTGAPTLVTVVLLVSG